MSLVEFFVSYPEFIRRVRDISRHSMFKTELELSIIDADPENTQEFLSSLLNVYLWILDGEIEIKKRGINPSEHVFARGIITRIIRNLAYPYLMVNKTRLQKNLQILANWLSSIKLQQSELGISPSEYNEEYPSALLEMRALSFVRATDNFFFTIIDESPIRKLFEDVMVESKKLIARFNINRLDFINFARFYPETTAPVLRMKELLDISVQFWDGKKYPLSPPDFITMLAEYYLTVKASELLLDRVPPCEDLKDKLRWGPKGFRGVVYYFTDENCSVCRELEKLIDFWDLIGYLESNKIRAIIAERSSIEGKMLFDACFVKGTPSLLYGILFLHGIAVPNVNLRNKEERIRLKKHFRKIFQEFWFPPLQTIEIRNIVDLWRIIESPLLKYEREYILRNYRD
ncbi:MAG: hypothetical protein ACTSX9_03965 [Candidatus Njordarchaeales archaeon]